MSDIIRAVTPIALGIIGGVIAVVAMLAPMTDQRFTQALGVSGGFIAGAAGLAQAGGKQQQIQEIDFNNDK
jgi:hypothetical protein